jgi:predicted porin
LESTVKNKVLALAALGTLTAAGCSYAQSSVAVYGLVDVGVDYTNHANAAGDSVMRVVSGGMNTSRFGFRGNEDLGGGLKAVFQLEGGFFADQGTIDGALFRRQANAGLEGAFGRLVVGRSYTTTYDFMLPFDPMGYAPNYSWVTSGNGTGVSKYGMTTGFDNIIKYQGEFGGVKLGASYGVGEVAGSSSDSAKMVLGAGWGAGPFAIAATYDRVNGNTVAATGRRTETTTAHLGASYALSGSLALKGGMRNYKQVPAAAASPDVRANLYWLGANYKATQAMEVTAALYYQDVKNVASAVEADPSMLVLSSKYFLSKRTFLYATTAYAKARHNQLVGLTRDNTADGGVTGFGSSQTGVTVGIQHRF